ncbi:hypothetical protein [Halorarius litoreus]|uniref:hypothetical protein n=1 Tax=Halorarius litoreus TaxID=2962676 RepID=UPI0020CD49C2|nr:hypothetical protein [Halorarius litoreus]
MDRKTRVIETVRDRKGELFLGAMALGGVGVAAATLQGDDADDEDENEPDEADDP